ncbi:hypothetical protein CSOJ01_06759 [Colletotrichum sojae]|uniref:Uncharacterized protein n=1 Tax=Colletotrichum sojae TaxID=2175907 RepID=A0A8H6MUN5_9PEZI|nr:hypothetical protein CSOJ01_06759 [Colletotrichum sojae]
MANGTLLPPTPLQLPPSFGPTNWSSHPNLPPQSQPPSKTPGHSRVTRRVGDTSISFSTGYYTTPCNGSPPDYETLETLETLQGEVMHMQTPVEKVSLRPPQRRVSDVWHHVEP